MTRRTISPMQVLVAAVIVMTILSLLPLRYLGWVNDVAAIVRLPAFPFADMGTRLRVWVTGGPQRSGPKVDDVEFLQDELDRYRALAQEWRRLAEEYAQRNAELQRTSMFGLNVPFSPVYANIVGRNTESDGSVYVLNVGRYRYRVAPNAVAVHGAHLLGQVSNVSRLQSELVPITDESFDLIRAVVVPGEGNDNLERRAAIHLENQGDGTFTGALGKDLGVEVGDFVHLDDPAWPQTAQSLIVGTIRSIEPHRENPVLVHLVVRPVYRVDDLASVVIKVEQPGAADQEAPEPEDTET